MTATTATPPGQGRRIATSLSWSALIVYANRVLSVATLLLLAKLLDPKDFGIVAVAAIVLEMLKVLKDMGMGEALIYHEDESPEMLDTAHTILVGYSTVLFLIAAALAPFAATYYGDPVIAPVLWIMASTLVWDATRAVPRTLYRKRMDFRRLVIPEVVPFFVAAVVSVAMAYFGFGVWSLVARSLITSVLGAVLLRMDGVYRPRLRFHRGSATLLFGYGRHIVGTTLFLVTLYNVDRFYVSAVLGLAALGMFELGLRIAELSKEVSFVIGSVMFPVFSRLNRDGDGLKAAFLKTLSYTGLITVPLAVAAATFGPALIDWLYGTKWHAAADVLRVLALYALFRSFSSIIHDMFKAVGKPYLMQRFTIVRLICIGALGVPALKLFGLVGISGLIVATYCGVFIAEMAVVSRLLRIPFVPSLAVVIKPAVLAGTIIPGVYLASGYLIPSQTALQLIGGAIVAAALYVAALFLVERKAIREVRTIILSRAAA